MGQVSFPMQAMSSFLLEYPEVSGLLLHSGQQYLSYSVSFLAMLGTGLSSLELQAVEFDTHSLRFRVATAVSSLGSLPARIRPHAVGGVQIICELPDGT